VIDITCGTVAELHPPINRGNSAAGVETLAKCRVGDNRHPVDVLAEAREQLKKWKEIEEAARQKIIDSECGLVGDEYTATVSRKKPERPDPEAMRRVLSPSLLEQCMKVVPFFVVHLKKRVEAKEI
jgi:hypothetical protein